MKKIITFITFTFIVLAQASAQDLYKKVYETSIEIVNSPNSSDEQIQINQFKVTVLNYMASQVKKSGEEKDSLG